MMDNTTKLEKKQRLLFIDGLRGLAAIAVVLYHLHGGTVSRVFFTTLPQPIQIILNNGAVGVQIFFVISGFIIVYSLENIGTKFTYYTNFLLRRLVRLSPPYWAAIFLVISLRCISNAILADRLAPLPSWQQISANLFYLQYLLNLGSLQDVFWTLCLEIQFYLVFCLVLFVAQKFNQSNILSENNSYSETSIFIKMFCLLSIFAISYPLEIINNSFSPGLFLPHFYTFLLGMLACWALDNKVPKYLFYIYALICIYASIIHQRVDILFSALTAISIYIVAIKGKLKNWLNLDWLQYIAKISYSLYLTHSIIGNPILNVGYRLTKDSIVFAFFWFLAAILVSLITAHCFWNFLEKPSVVWSKYFKN